MIKFFSDRVVFILKRIDLGVRCDVEFEAAVSAYMNLTLHMKFLKFVVDTEDVGNVLETGLFTALSSLEAQVALRARAVFLANQRRAVPGLSTATSTSSARP